MSVRLSAIFRRRMPHFDIVSILLQAGADLNLPGTWGEVARQYVAAGARPATTP